MNRQIYPLKEELTTLEETKWTLEELGEYLIEIGFNHYGKAKYDIEKKELTLVTGGWSGNEEIISSLQKNLIFWHTYWESTHRGGLHIFIKRD